MQRSARADTNELTHTQLQVLNPIPSPAAALLETTSTWKLIYSDAPDIVGGGNQGLLAPCSGVIGQRFEASTKTVTNIVERIPGRLITPLLPTDSLVQEVVLSAEAASATRVRLGLKGTQLTASTILNQNASWLPRLKLGLPGALPFGEV
eukprot:Tamp_21214.p1 GENE.Tamp_21214~~Tamp_21214.p1  ORF type:complete len:150 (+),score=2.06 Tamp_21214:238-687(+)